MTHLAALSLVSLTIYPDDHLKASPSRTRKVQDFTWLVSSQVSLPKSHGCCRRHETPNSETKDFTTWGSESSISFHCYVSSPCFPPPQVPQGCKAGSDGCCQCSGLVSKLKDPMLREPQSFIMGYKQICSVFAPKGGHYFYCTGQQPNLLSVPGGRHYLCLLRLFSIQASFVWLG